MKNFFRYLWPILGCIWAIIYIVSFFNTESAGNTIISFKSLLWMIFCAVKEGIIIITDKIEKNDTENL